MTLQDAIEADDVDELYRLIEGDEKLLDDHESEGPVPNTPLHDAADKGKTKVAMEIAILKPSFARKLNRAGYSPMHLALQKKHYDIVRALMTLNPELIRVQGRGGITPLHFVAGEKGDDWQENEKLLELLAEFLCACKSSIEDSTSQCETAVHIAVKRGNTEAFEVLFGWLKRVHMTEIMYWKDQDDNTVLDNIVASIVPQLKQKREQLEIGVLRSITNKEDAKVEALEFLENLGKLLRKELITTEEAKGKAPLSKLLSKELTAFEKFRFWWGHHAESARDIILLVATLITTATYQAALSPPGGYWDDNSPANSTVVAANSTVVADKKPHQAGNIILSGSKLYLFTALNSSVFLVSMGAILFTAVSILPRSIAVFLLMWLLGISYCTTTAMGFPKSERAGANLIEVIYPSLQVFVFLVPLILCMSYYNFRLRIEATGRSVDNFLESKDRK